MSGLSAVSGSWNTMAMSLPRILRSRESAAVTRFCPARRAGWNLTPDTFGQQPHEGGRRHGLAGAGLADQADPLAALHPQIEILDQDRGVGWTMSRPSTCSRAAASSALLMISALRSVSGQNGRADRRQAD